MLVFPGIDGKTQRVQTNLFPFLNLDRLDRAAGKPPAMVPVVDEDPQKPSALPSPDSYQFFTQWIGKSNWENKVTLKS